MKIENMKKIEHKSIKAFFSLNLEKLTIHNMKLMRQEGQKFWISPPDEKYTDKDDKVKYKRLVDITDEPLMEKILTLAAEAYNN